MNKFKLGDYAYLGNLGVVVKVSNEGILEKVNLPQDIRHATDEEIKHYEEERNGPSND